MALLRHVPYYKTPNTREISAADFRSLGVEEQGKTSWNPSNKHTAEVSDEAAAALQEVEPRDWKIVEDASEATIAESGVVAQTSEDDVGTQEAPARRRSRSQ